MKTSIIWLLCLLFSGSAHAFVSIDEAFRLPNVGYVASGADVITASGSSVQILSRNTNSPKTFYLEGLYIEEAPNVISATGVHMGTCSLQIPSGTTVMTFNFNNSTNSQIDRQQFQPALPMVIPSSFAVSCYPQASTSEYWNVNYVGFEVQ